MALPALLLQYFAELAPVGRGPRWNHAPADGDLVPISWPWQVLADEGGARVFEARSSDMWRLWSAARINGSRNFLRLGWLFLSGTADVGGKATKIFVPLASTPVRLRRPPRVGDPNTYHVVADADLVVPESLFADHRVRLRLNDALDEVADQSFPLDAAITNWELVKPFVELFCEEAGLPVPTTVSQASAAIEPNDGPLAVHTGLAVYTTRDRSAINLESTLREWSSTNLTRSALAGVYAGVDRTGEPDLTASVASSLPLNRRQQQAVIAARQLPITVVSGPPGTGKTHTAVAVAIDEVAQGRSVLVAAQSDDAIDAIEAMLTRYASPRHVRFGSRSSRKRVAVELSDGLVAEPSDSIERTASRLGLAQAELDRIRSSVVARLNAEAAFTSALEMRRRYSWCVADAPGLSGVVAEESASDVAERLLVGDDGGIFAPLRRSVRTRRLCKMLAITPDVLKRLEGPALELIRAERTIRAGQEVAAQSIGALFAELDDGAEAVRTMFGRHVEAIRSGRSWEPGATRAVGLLATALRSGQAARRRALRTIDMSSALNALPLWLGTITDVDDVLPVRPGMFDVVIVDEASQVNQVRAATTLARGKRGVVIGDPRQLRHVSFVGDQAMEQAAAKLGLKPSPLLDIRRSSLFDVAAGRTPVMQLSEHYRSSRHLIEFSNRHFYDGRLQLMTEHPATSSEDVIHVERLAGERNSSGVVEAELEHVFDLIGETAASGGTSIGVITPFRAQADAIAREAQKRLSPDQLDSLDLRIATVHGFQGNERDDVIISLGVGQGDTRPLRFVEDPNLFNVMVTRARSQLTLLTSVDEDDLHDGLLLDYINHADHPPRGPSQSGVGEREGWKAAVVDSIRPYGLPTWVDYPVGEHRIDIAVGEGDSAVGVECIVHADGVEAHIERHVALRRAGWTLMTAMESRWLARPEDAGEAIARRVMGERRRDLR